MICYLDGALISIFDFINFPSDIFNASWALLTFASALFFVLFLYPQFSCLAPIVLVSPKLMYFTGFICFCFAGAGVLMFGVASCR